MMKKTLLSLATILTAGVLSMAANCSDSNVESCTADTDCTVEGQICDVAAEQCVDQACTEDNDCAIAGSSSETILAQDCSADADCADVCIVDSLGNSFCAVAEDDTIPFTCADDVANARAINAEKADGTTASICVDSDSTCDDAGQCG